MKKYKISHRILAVLLILVMVLTALPISDVEGKVKDQETAIMKQSDDEKNMLLSDDGEKIPEITATETPEATPTGTPEATPTETPEATPAETPEVTPGETAAEISDHSKPELQIKWKMTPTPLNTGASGTIEMTAQLLEETASAEQKQDPVSVKVRITLSEEEAKALTDFQTEGTDPSEAAKGEGSQPNGFSLEKKSNDTWELSFSLESGQGVTQILQVQVPGYVTAPFTFEIDETDITAERTDGVAVSLAEGYEKLSFPVSASCNWELLISGDTEEQDFSEIPYPDVELSMQLKSQNAGKTEGVLYTQQQCISAAIVLPDTLVLPEGTLAWNPETGMIMAGNAPVVRIMAEGQENFSVTDLTYAEGKLQFAISRSRSAEDTVYAEELEDTTYMLVLQGASLSRTEGEPYENPVIQLEASLVTTGLHNQGSFPQQAKPYSVPVNLNSRNTLEITQYFPAWNQTLYWVDNNNEDQVRLENSDYATKGVKLYYSLDGGAYRELTEEDCSGLGLEQIPQIAVTGAGPSQRQLSLAGNSLPSEFEIRNAFGDVLETHSVVWEIRPQNVEGYEFHNVTEENIQDYPLIADSGNYGWYYVRLMDFTFHVVLRSGDFGADKIGEAVREAVNACFSFKGNAATGETDLLLKDMAEQIHSEPAEDGKSAVLTIEVRKFNLDGSRITYTVESRQKELENITGLPDGDTLSISYDNTSVPNWGSVTDRVCEGGTLILTLTGGTDYEAEKVWLDNGEKETKEKRPQGEFQLWRYRKGQSYTTAAPVRDSNGEIISLALDPFQDSQEIVFETAGQLDKYDADGYEYLYVVREYLSGDHAGNYEQVFGVVNEDQTITDRIDQNGTETETNHERTGGNSYVYNGGTISNRIRNTVAAEVKKTWKAAAFQADFTDVRISLRLQSRPLGSEETVPWEDTDTTLLLDEFYAENLTQSKTEYVSKYDAHGKPLEYRWVEDGVYKGNSDNLLQEDGTFTLVQSAGQGEKNRAIQYYSEVKTEIREDGSSSTVIENCIENKITYTIDKVWLDEERKEVPAPEGAKTIFSLYRSIQGSPLLTAPIGQVTMDGVMDAEAVPVEGLEGVTVQEKKAWEAIFEGLPEFDEEGHQYEYMILETEGPENYVPQYETAKDDKGNYTTKVINAPGFGHQIMVMKNWIDDSDTLHREPVTIQVYDRKTDEPIDRATTVLGEDGVWNQLVGIGNYEPDQVYILETKMGNTDLPLNAADSDQMVPAGDSEPESPLGGENTEENKAIRFQARYHRYEATYGVDKIENIWTYTVTNRRLGNIDLTVTKNWVDGENNRGKIQKILDEIKQEKDGKSPELYLQLKFVNTPEGGTITREGLSQEGENAFDTVTIANETVPIVDNTGNKVCSQQKIDLDKANSNYYFFHLPKYTTTGASVQYEVQEVWIDIDGTELTRSQLAGRYPELGEVLNGFSASYTQTEYTSNDGKADSNDTQSITVTNRISQTKNVRWYKKWADAYTYENNQRPDIYLDIYQVIHTSADSKETRVELVQKDYKWEYLETAGQEGENNDRQWHWTALLENVPKFDSYGFEILYYAVEKTHVNYVDYDYGETIYAITENGTWKEIGTKTSVEQSNLDQKYAISVTESGDDCPYALVEEGTFVNYLDAQVTIEGQKLWSSLPDGYPAADLPPVTFGLYQNVQGEEASNRVAWITITDWENTLFQNGSYRFTLEHLGDNSPGTEESASGEANGRAEENQEFIPKYNGQGQRYEYKLVEEKINLGDKTEAEDLFDSTIHTYLAENVYQPKEKGSIRIKKLLWLPLGEDNQPEAYPAVTFQLSRTYTTNAGESSQEEAVDTITWTSRQVEEAYRDNGDGSLLEWFYIFENLERYAPNGSEYQYTVTEVKDSLGGYETWAVKGEIETTEEAFNQTATEENKGEELPVTLTISSASEDSLPVAATFLNVSSQERETISLSGKKIWEDYENAFGTRPEFSKEQTAVTLTLFRYAYAQPGQGNAIEKEEVPAGSYDIQWEETPGTNIWSYTITGKEKGELEKYAPNGMPWRYRIQETIGSAYDHYKVRPANGIVEMKDSSQETECAEMNDLTNSIYAVVDYSKNWVDQEGNIIREDLLGFDLTVHFALQVGETGADGVVKTWQEAETYFKDILKENYSQVFDSAYDFTPFLSGRIGDTAIWGKEQYFRNLPAYRLQENGTTPIYTELQYRVVETKIEYSGKTQTITVVDGTNDGTYAYSFADGLFEPAYWPDGRVQEGEIAEEGKCNRDTTRALYNRLSTTKLTVTKRWVGDHSNSYNTRPEGTETDWQTDFLVQKSTDENQWEPVKVYGTGGASRDLIVTISGGNDSDSETIVLTGLPSKSIDGESYFYRALELQPGYTTPNGSVQETNVVQPESAQKYYSAYDVWYNFEDATVVTNSITEKQNIYARKNWIAEAGKSVTLKLQYKGTDGRWKDFRPSAAVTLDGEADGEQERPYYEKENWLAVWTDVPIALPGSELMDGKTVYQVVEVASSGQIQVGNADGTGTEEDPYDFTNVVTTSYTVTKRWYGVYEKEEKKPEIVIGLYRTTEDTKDPAKDAVIGTDGKQLTVTMQDGMESHTFTGLPKYDAASEKKYHYYARELFIEGVSVENQQEYEVNYSKTDDVETVIINKRMGSLTVEKVWLDADNSGHTRPSSVEIALYRQTVGEQKKLVAQVTLDETNGWQYTWENLPQTDAEGVVYEYTAEETGDLPGDYVTQYETGDADADGVLTITNVLQAKRDISVVKLWMDEENPNRPGEVTLVLKADGLEKERITLSDSREEKEGTWQHVFMKLLGREENPWAYTFQGLDKYDTQGKEIVYTIEEVSVPEGYQVIYQGDAETGFTVANTITTQVTVEKKWKSQIPETERKEVLVRLYEKNEDDSLTPVMDGDQQKSLTLNAENEWKGCFADLPKYHGDGTLYRYTVKEEKVGEEEQPEMVYDIQISETEEVDGGLQIQITNGRKPLPTPTPTGTPVPTVTPKPSGTPTPKPSETPTPEPSGTPTPKPSGTPTPEPSGTPTPEPSGTPTPKPSGTPTPEPSETPTPKPSGTPTPKPSGTPSATPTETVVDPPSGSSPGGGEPPVQGTPDNETEAVKTGDETPVCSYSVILCLAGISGGMLVIMKKGGKKKKIRNKKISD